MHGPNVWPDPQELPGWRQQVQAYFGAMLELSRAIARGLALSLSLPETFFTDKMQDPVAQLLMLRYPPPPKQQQAAGGAGSQEQYVGCGAHTDCGFLTILAQVRNSGPCAAAEPAMRAKVLSLLQTVYCQNMCRSQGDGVQASVDKSCRNNLKWQTTVACRTRCQGCKSKWLQASGLWRPQSKVCNGHSQLGLTGSVVYMWCLDAWQVCLATAVYHYSYSELLLSKYTNCCNM